MAEMMTVDFQTCFIFTLVGIFSVLCYSLIFRKQKDSRLGFDLPPSPPSLPIIGHLHLILSLLLHRSLQKIASKYGPLLHLRILYVPIVLVSSASLAYEIFKSHDEKVSSRNFPVNDECLLFGTSGFITAPYGEYWKFMKKLIVTKLLGPQAIERLRGTRADEVEHLYLNLLDKAMKKDTINVGEEAMKLTNNSMCKILMGRVCPEDVERVKGLVAETDALTKKFFLATTLGKVLKKLGISPFNKEIMGVSCRFEKVLERILVEHEEKQEEQGMDLMDILLEAHRDQSAEYKITRNHIKSLLVDLLIAGSDTTAHAIEWTMAEIINNPKTLDRLRGEIDSVVGTTRLIQETDLPNLPYLQAVIKEGLRLHPAAPIAMRTSHERCDIKGFHIAEKTTLVINLYAIMRDADYWEDPDEFKPERFLASFSRSGQENKIREDVLKYIPFGSGRRGCPGSNLAYLYLGTAIGVMVECFDWKTKEEKVNMDEAPGTVTLAMAHPLICTLAARTISPLTSTS